MDIFSVIKERFISGAYVGRKTSYIYNDIGAKSKSEKKSIDMILKDLEKSGAIVKSGDGYYLLGDLGLIKGIVRSTENGYAFLSPEKGGDDMFIPPKNLCGANDKDEVLAVLVEEGKGGESDVVKVVKIIKRGIKDLCGTLVGGRGNYFIEPDNTKFIGRVKVMGGTLGADVGDKVMATIVSYDEKGRADGRIIKVIGTGGELFTEEKSILLSYDYPENFPYKVLKEAESINEKIDDNQLIGRLNLTDRQIITIDGEHSRDFDDAVEVEILENGNYLLGVHIADVSEYVKAGSLLDKEALSRSTSVYFPDMVIPMLPEKLSNGICSLNEGAIRLTLSCIMEIDKSGEVIDKKISKSYIKSAHRMTYTQVQAMLDGDKKALEKYSDIADMVLKMGELQSVLTSRRTKKGKIDLDVPEAEISVDGGEVSVDKRGSLRAYKVIEEFMVTANECVAEYAFFMDVPFIYRVHDKPKEETAENFISFLNVLGITVKWRAEICRPSDFSAVLDKLDGSPLKPLVNKVMLRSMQKAVYSPDNIGHFGLSSKCYCHFTSPIRRYPDLVVHRVIKMIIDGRIGELNDLYKGFIENAARISSENERKADEAERAVDDLYKAEFMSRNIGGEFDAVISGVTANGIYSELENTVEGFTPIAYLPRANYTYDAKNYCLYSRKRKFKLGDKVRVGVLDADVSSRKVEFIILGKID